MTSRPHSLLPWIVATVLALPTLYVVSFGPACWFAVRTVRTHSRIFATAYRPMWWIITEEIPVAGCALECYAILGMRSGTTLSVPPDRNWGIVIGWR
jgi:hypothetical protein